MRSERNDIEYKLLKWNYWTKIRRHRLHPLAFNVCICVMCTLCICPCGYVYYPYSMCILCYVYILCTLSREGEKIETERRRKKDWEIMVLSLTGKPLRNQMGGKLLRWHQVRLNSLSMPKKTTQHHNLSVATSCNFSKHCSLISLIPSIYKAFCSLHAYQEHPIKKKPTRGNM